MNMAKQSPIRLQLSRKKGFNLQEHSRAANGMECVNCARPSRWGNPYKVGEFGTAKVCVQQYKSELWTRDREEISAELSGKNLACWCSLDAPCHADVLLEIANTNVSEVE